MTNPNPPPDGGYPGCDCCACPRGICSGNHPDAPTFLKAAKGMPAYKVAWAMFALSGFQIDFSGCSKTHMAKAWSERVDNNQSTAGSLPTRTVSDLFSALRDARDGDRLTPRGHARRMLLDAERKARAAA